MILLLGCLWPAPGRAEPPEQRLSIQLGVGLVGFPGMGDLNPGAAFGISAGWRVLPPLALELGYLGAIFTEEREGGGSREAAIENGGYLALIGAPFSWAISPYLLAGAGVSHRRLVGEEDSTVLRPGTFARLPLGAGADLRIRLFTLGVRGTYDFVFRSLEKASPRLDDELMITLRLGAIF